MLQAVKHWKVVDPRDAAEIATMHRAVSTTKDFPGLVINNTAKREWLVRVDEAMDVAHRSNHG